jgi:hypothetical protein
MELAMQQICQDSFGTSNGAGHSQPLFYGKTVYE